jgi:hypothetical protein
VAAATAGLVLGACGGNARQDAQERSGHFQVQVPTATFPGSQSLSQHTQMVITVRNADHRTIPDVAVTITDANFNTSAAAFGERVDKTQQGAANFAAASRPVWIVDQGPALHGCEFSCVAGGPGGGTSAYSNTWALGALAPGASTTFLWKVTAVKPGVHVVHYRVAAGLNGKAIAELAGGQPPEGTFTVTIHSAPQQSYVNDQGQIVKAH